MEWEFLGKCSRKCKNWQRTEFSQKRLRYVYSRTSTNGHLCQPIIQITSHWIDFRHAHAWLGPELERSCFSHGFHRDFTRISHAFHRVALSSVKREMISGSFWNALTDGSNSKPIILDTQGLNDISFNGICNSRLLNSVTPSKMVCTASCKVIANWLPVWLVL